MLRPLELDRTQNALSAHWPWSPHEFIRTPASFLAADKALMLASWLKPLSAENDLRFNGESAIGELALLGERLPWDSTFFGYEVARLNAIAPLGAYQAQADYAVALQAWLEAAQARGIRYIFAPVVPEDVAAIRALCALGFVLIETRAIFVCDLAQFSYPERFAARAATPDDIPSLAETARVMVNPYDRFHADPFILAADADRLMETWIEASLLRGFADVTLVPDQTAPKAFNTLRYHHDERAAWGLGLGQTVLTAVHHEQRGWYRKLIVESNYHLRAQGLDYHYVTTQITNRAVIAVLEGLGFRFGRSEHIFRMVL